MKVNSQIRNLKQNIIVSINKSISKEPDHDILSRKYDFIIHSVDAILNKKFSGSLCYQELYNTINEVLLFTLPEEFTNHVEGLFISYSQQVASQLYAINENKNIESFLEEFNAFWKEVCRNFSLLKKILTKFEKKSFAAKNFKNKTIWGLCNNF
jgi:hypothetical protein